MVKNSRQSLGSDDKNFDVPGSSQEQNNGSSQGVTGSKAEVRPFICYGASTAQLNPGAEHKRRYRSGGTKLITVAQAINMKAAVRYAELISRPLTAHFTIHWVGADAGDDPDGKLFAEVREGYARWLRRRGVPFAGVWCREKRSGGQAEVEHAHLIVHLPNEWLNGAKRIHKDSGVEGSAELLQAEAALHRIVDQYAGRLDH